MGLKSLHIQHFRNISSAQLKFDAELILITGDNAAGKTSLLETIFYLSYGRSFRSHQLKHLIEYNQPEFMLVAQTDQDTRIGIQRSKDEQQIRVNQQSVHRIAELSTLLPVLALHPDSHLLISSGPEHRRQYMDWSVFHVEHHFIQHWKLYKSALAQRNAALRSHQGEKLCRLWDKQLVSAAAQIEVLRLQTLEDLQSLLAELTDEFFPEHRIDLTYRRGWSAEQDYAECLGEQFLSDYDKGFTQSGPHRADIRITFDGKPAHIGMSRGQQKVLVCLMKIAQLILYTQKTQQKCILLFDDLPAELDTEHQNHLLSRLRRLDIQLFVTAIDASQIDISDWQGVKVFHVEHGQVNAVELAEIS